LLSWSLDWRKKGCKEDAWEGTHNLSCQAEIMAIRSDSVSRPKLVLPSFAEVQISDVITQGLEDEVGQWKQ